VGEFSCSSKLELSSWETLVDRRGVRSLSDGAIGKRTAELRSSSVSLFRIGCVPCWGDFTKTLPLKTRFAEDRTKYRAIARPHRIESDRPDSSRSGSSACRARVSRRLGRYGRQYRLAIEAGPEHRGTAARDDRDSRQAGRATHECGHLPGPSRRGCAVRLQNRALVGVPQRTDGPSASAVLRPARLHRGRSAQARARVARLDQSVPVQVFDEEAGVIGSHQPHHAQAGSQVRSVSMDGSW
jgi:hypothetical protein